MERHKLAGGLPGASAPSPHPDSESHESQCPMPLPALPGYAVVRLLGRGGSGDVWLVRERTSGKLAAAKIVRWSEPENAPESAREARRELRVRKTHAHPHLLELRDAVPCHEASRGEIALVAEYAAGGSLARLVGVRGRLSVGETVTSVGPIAQALAALHAEGTDHQDVSPANILFTAHGKPLLSDFGTARMVADVPAEPRNTPGFGDPTASDAGDASRGAADVYGLGAVAWFCLTGQAPARTADRPPLTLVAEDVPVELAVAIDAALADAPRERPTAAEFARAVFRSARPAPVDLAPAVDEDVLQELVTRRQPEARQRLPWARLLRRTRHAAGIRRAAATRTRSRPRVQRLSSRIRWLPLTMAAMFATVVGIAWALIAAGSSTAPAGPAATAAAAWTGLPDSLRNRASSDDPVQAVQGLAEIRALAVATSNRGLLERVNVPGSEASAADAALLDQLDAEGERFDGFTVRVVEASREPPGAAGDVARQQAVVRARVVSSGYAIVGADGQERKAPGAGSDQTLRVVVERADDGWRVARILPV